MMTEHEPRQTPTHGLKRRKERLKVGGEVDPSWVQWGPMPAELWVEAISLARELGVATVAGKLKMNHGALSRRTELCGGNTLSTSSPC
jgi:hypothetical protein